MQYVTVFLFLFPQIWGQAKILFLTKRGGFDCIGVTMKLFENYDIGISNEKTCCSFDDTEAARSVAYLLNMPHYVFNFAYDFKSLVIEKFINAYHNGETPNPCIDCNRSMKFERLLYRAKQLGMDYSTFAERNRP